MTKFVHWTCINKKKEKCLCLMDSGYVEVMYLV